MVALWNGEATGVAMPSPGDCESPLGEVAGLASGTSDRVAECSDPTGRTTACTEPLKSAHKRVRMEAWHIATPFRNQQERHTTRQRRGQDDGSH